QPALDALGREGNRGERVFDVVGDAARHLPPGGGLLDLQQVGQVFEHQHVAGGRTAARARRPVLGHRRGGDGGGGGRHGEGARPPGGGHFQLPGGGGPALRLAQQVLHLAQAGGVEQIL